MAMILPLSPGLKPGINFTIRHGLKWALFAAENLNSNIFILQVGELHEAKIKVALICKAKDIPSYVYENEHDSTIRSQEGARKALKEFYPMLTSLRDTEIDDLMVTCLGFEIIQGE